MQQPPQRGRVNPNKELQKTLKREAKRKTRMTIPGAAQSTLSRVKSFKIGNVFSRNKFKIYEVDDDMLELAQKLLPPEIPNPIQYEGQEEVALFVSTLNCEQIVGRIEPEVLDKWLPLGWEVYCLCLQSVENMSEIGESILSHLQTETTKYQELKHFATLEEANTGEKRYIVTYIYVDITLFKIHVERSTFGSYFFPRRDPTPSSTAASAGAFIVNLKIFDTEIKLVNLQLTPGDKNLNLRKADVEFLMAKINEDKRADHVFIAGDFSCLNLSQTDSAKLSNFINTKNTLPEWTSDRFAFLLQEFDEVNELKKHSRNFCMFHEMEISFPPTNHRSGNKTRLDTNALAEIFHTDYNLEELYSYSKDIPCYPDRIFYFTKEPALVPCLKASRYGTSEPVTLNNRVPVFATFRVGARGLGSDPTKLSSVEDRKELRKDYRATLDGLKKHKNPKVRQTNARRKMREFIDTVPPPPITQAELDRSRYQVDAPENLVNESEAEGYVAEKEESIDEPKVVQSKIKPRKPQNEVDNDLDELELEIKGEESQMKPTGPKEVLHNLTTALNSIVNSPVLIPEFNFVVPPPPPLQSSEKEVAVTTKTDSGRNCDTEDDDLDLTPKRFGSFMTVDTNLSKSSGLGKHFMALVDGMRTLNGNELGEVPPPPPPTESMERREVQKLKMMNQRQNKPDTMPPPPPSHMHGRFDSQQNPDSSLNFDDSL